MKQQEKEKEYETYVKEKTPVRKPGPAMAKAFVTGGIICTIGQTILNACEKMKISVRNRISEYRILTWQVLPELRIFAR